MGVEVERKFLVKNDTFKEGAKKCKIIQGFLNDDMQRMVRIRMEDEQAILTIKGPLEGISRKEFNYPIPLADAKQLLPLCVPPLIEKTRYLVNHNGLIWEVDEFFGENEGLVIAELELPDSDYAFEIPKWLGREVTADKRYYNANLVKNPYKSWKLTK